MKVEELRIKNSKGLQLAAAVEKPESDKKPPFVILLHGFTGWKEEKHIVSLANLLAENGIGSVRFDASGSGESEGTFEHDYRFSNYLGDVDSIYKFTLMQDWVDPKRIGIWGHSMGGQIAAYFASNNPELVAFCSSQGSRNVSKTKYGQEEWKAKGYKIFGNSHFKTIKLPYSFFEDRTHFDAAEVVNSISMPKLFIAGSKDALVPATVVKEVYAAAKEPKEYFEHPEAAHDYKNNQKILDEINQHTLEFFESNL